MKRVWLAELHRQWMVARGQAIAPLQRAFRRDWEKLLDAAGIVSAEDRNAARREAEQEHDLHHVKLHRLLARPYIIRKIELPLAAEPWLRGLFKQREPTECLRDSLVAVADAMARPHSRFPELWREWCTSLEATFRGGKNARPLYWRSPEQVRSMLEIIYRLTSIPWREGALIREVSIEVGLKSKGLERQRRGVEACLSGMFGRPMPLESLGVVLTDSRCELAGILKLHFPGGETQVFDKLRAVFGLSLSDLERAERASTSAARMLTVENSKTTLRRLASVNGDGDTLMAACSFPTKALLRLLELLPREMPIFHFGDTDPAGYHILSKLRENSRRPITPFLMERRPGVPERPLGEYDRALLPRLLGDPRLEDVRDALEATRTLGCKGDFEQETLGLPDLVTWPFYSRAESPRG
jgi:hypothetical protein